MKQEKAVKLKTLFYGLLIFLSHQMSVFIAKFMNDGDWISNVMIMSMAITTAFSTMIWVYILGGVIDIKEY